MIHGGFLTSDALEQSGKTPALLQELYESSGDAEGFGIALLLTSQIGIASIASIALLSEVLDLLAKLNTYMYMQRKTAYFTRLSGFVSSIIIEELKSLKSTNLMLNGALMQHH